MDRVPATFTLPLGRCCIVSDIRISVSPTMMLFQRTFFEQYHPSKPIIKIPEIDATHPSLVVAALKRLQISLPLIWCNISNSRPNSRATSGLTQRNVSVHSQFPVNVHSLAHADLHFSHPLTWFGTFVPIAQLGVEFIAPWTSPAVAVSIVVTQEVISACFLTLSYLERLIDRREEVFSQLWGERADTIEIGGCGVRGEAAEKVTELRD